MEYVKEVECKPNKFYDFYADIKINIEDGGVIMKEEVPLKADCYERIPREGKFDGILLLLIACLTLKSYTFTVHFYRKMNMK